MGFTDGFKRNQVEKAVAAVLRRDGDDAADLRTRIKRLLDADRALGRTAGAEDERPHFAFYTGAAPGSGTEVWFSGYEAFSLLLALRLLDHGWPQGTAVRVMRRLRPALEREHARILRQSPTKLFDEETVRRHAAPGVLATGSADPVFLAITRGKRANERDGDRALYDCDVLRGQSELTKYLCNLPPGSLTTSSEISGSVHLLANRLSTTAPKPRGRA